MPRGRSTSADRSVAGLVSRSTMITFVRSLRVGDIVDIEWRIVPLDDKAPDALACPFLTFSGPVISCEDEKCEVMVDYSQVEADGSMTAMGVYPLPPRALTNAFVEVKSLKKKFKGGTACLLSELIRDGELPEQALSMILKHKNNQDPVQSYTAGYLSVTARLNILQNKDIFKAAVLLRRMIFRDI
jgi:hypothetical protein